jgi:hypothetical protein
MVDNPVRVLFIGGYSRSGSTLLSRVLAQAGGYVTIGELCYFWERGFCDNRKCGCGQRFWECEFWNSVVEEAFGSRGGINGDEMLALWKEMQSDRAVPFLIFPFLRSIEFRQKFDSYADANRRIYRAIQTVSGNRLIVDSSKQPRYACVLNEIPDIHLQIIHLIRDSRAAAYSWKKKKGYLKPQSPVRSAVEWNLSNGFMETLRLKKVKMLPIRYEDLVTSPMLEMAKISRFIGMEWPVKALLENHGFILLGADHMLSGNPNRFEHGLVNIRLDQEWQEKMPTSQKAAVTTFTWPFLLRYRYIGKIGLK